MSLGGYIAGAAAGAAIDAATKKAEMKQRLKGRTPEQQEVIKYFYRAGGCLSKYISDDEYDSMVRNKIKSLNLKQRAINKIGLDESEISEIEPVYFEGPLFDSGKTLSIYGKDRKLRSSAWQCTWIFFSDTEIYVYQYTLNMDEDGKRELTDEYFYKDITNFSATTDSVEVEIADKTDCTGKTTYIRKTIETDKFALVVPGEKFYCSMQKTDYTERAIQGMKAKLREKKL